MRAAAPRLALTLTTYLGLIPFEGWRFPTAWLVAMLILIVWERRRPGRPSWLLSLGYSGAAADLVMFHAGAAQTLGVTLFGVIIFEVLVSDYTDTRRLIVNLSPPLLSIVFIQLAAGAALLQGHEPLKVATLVASPIAVLSVFRNLQRKLTRNRSELSMARDAAEAAVVAKSDFLANMSHEIRTPLTSILGFTTLLENSQSLSEEARRHVRRIATGGQSLLVVVNDILDFSKLEANQVTLDPQPFNPLELIEGAVALVAGQAAAKGLALQTDIQGDLPPVVMADSDRLRQILLNLLTNAIKFTATGGVTVTARYHMASDRLSVAVRDTGPGIPAESRARLFTRFSQVDSSVSRRFGGTGLGLAICKALVGLMGGEIGVDSVEGEGSTFSFRVPAPVASAVIAPSASAPEGLGDPVRQGAILIADDVAHNRELVRIILETLGYTVDEAAGGAEAIQAAIAKPYDLILMDMQMPDVDGLAASRIIRAAGGQNATTPILAFSANVMADQIAECLAAGMNDHIAKPIQPAELLTKVARWLGPADEAEPIARQA